MARRDLAAELARKPLGVQLGVLAGVLAVCGFFYWQFVYSSLADEQDSLAAQRKSLSKKEKVLKQREKEWIDLLQKKEQLDAQLRENRITLPASSELPAFFMHLQKQAAAAGVSVLSWSRMAESAVETYVRVPVKMDLTGTFYQINNYFRLLSQTDRIISVSGLSLAPQQIKNGEIILRAAFTATTYRQKDRPPDTSLAKEPRPTPANKPQGARGKRRRSPGRFAGAAADKASAVKKETGGQAKRETGGHK